MNGISFTVDFDTFMTIRNRGNRIMFYLENEKEFRLFMPIEGFVLKTSIEKAYLDDRNITRETFIMNYLVRGFKVEDVRYPDTSQENASLSSDENIIKSIGLMNIKKFIGIDFSLVSTAMLNYIKDYDFPLVSGLTKKEKELLKELFIRALTENWTMFELERKINEIVKDDVKTDMILRTETIRIANEGALRVYDSEGIKKVKWIATPSFPGGRTCEICLNNNGKIYDLEEAKGMIPAHPRCRCAWSAVI